MVKQKYHNMSQQCNDHISSQLIYDRDCIDSAAMPIPTLQWKNLVLKSFAFDANVF